MNSIKTLCQTLLVSTGLCLLSVPGTYAVVSAQPARLLSAITNYNEVSAWEATYYFTLTVPASATDSLQQVALTQIQGLEAISFNPQESFAFEGNIDTANLSRRGQKLGITLANSENKSRSVIVTFDKPVAPGQTITIGLKPHRNPLYDGVYQFQVQTISTGQSTYNPIIGTARLQFYGVAGNE
ncbi:MAG: DUF2808 domain-containing protein [Mojavia pulchra JT2-VF2]|jgi:hypothetical protein|uniref:DUF2808 domain-containing protein n=1 Tax=Mojavia pulchra JT2-VF2 TaxID=287848 RepID=A0A951UJA0_9NOST|nr:DUF2808 domain-containing protein [Mojavia pulchra JT2-VF2]